MLRTWFEPGVPVRFRTRGVEVVSGRGERPVFTASTVDEACQAVRDWLEAAGAAAAVTPR